MPWFGVRSVYRFGQKADGTNIFEERIVGLDPVSWTPDLRCNSLLSELSLEVNGALIAIV